MFRQARAGHLSPTLVRSGNLSTATDADVSRENFEATLDLIDQQYGSLSEYIENQLGFSKAEQQQLREKYLNKDNPSNDNPSNNQWGAETPTFKVNNSTDVILKKVEGGESISILVN